MLPISLKAFERCLYNQFYRYLDNILSMAQYGLHKVSARSIH